MKPEQKNGDGKNYMKGLRIIQCSPYSLHCSLTAVFAYVPAVRECSE